MCIRDSVYTPHFQTPGSVTDSVRRQVKPWKPCHWTRPISKLVIVLFHWRSAVTSSDYMLTEAGLRFGEIFFYLIYRVWCVVPMVQRFNLSSSLCFGVDAVWRERSRCDAWTVTIWGSSAFWAPLGLTLWKIRCPNRQVISETVLSSHALQPS